MPRQVGERGHGRHLALAAVLAALLGALPGAQAPAQGEPYPRARTLLSLVEAQRSEGLDAEAFEERIRHLGPSAVRDLQGLLLGRLPGAAGGPRLELDPSTQASLVACVRLWPAQEVLGELAAGLSAHASPAERLVALRLASATSDPACVPLAIQILAGLDPVHLQSGPVQDAAEAAWYTLFQGRGGDAALGVLAGRLTSLDPALLPGLIRALARLERGAAVPLLERLEFTSPSLDAVLLEALGATPPWDERVLDGSVARLLRRRLADEDAGVRRAAAMALARLRGGAAAPDLVALLADEPDSRVRRAALLALRALSGLDWPDQDSERWASWLAKEEAWLASRSATLLETAETAAPAEAATALREISMHGLFRERLAQELEAVLARPETEVVMAALGALARLGAGSAVAPLAELLEDPRPGVPAAALAALRASTENRCPADPVEREAWIAASL
jgi:hypothetical protein